MTYRMRTPRLPLLCVALCVFVGTWSPLSSQPDLEESLLHLKPQGTEAQLGLAGYAKVLCSAVFVSGRDPDVASRQSGYFLVPEELQDHVDYAINWNDQSVEMRLGDSLVRIAKYYGDQGCIIHGADEPYIHFDPVQVESSLPDAAKTRWPMGDITSEIEWTGIAQTFIEQAVEAAFAPEALTAAFVVVHQGQIIAEHYDNGADMYMQLESWSMGKSLTATLIGRLMQMGKLSLDDPAPVPEWQAEGDPRAEITIRNLLQMSGGLNFTSHHDRELGTYSDYLDHFYIYTGAVDAFAYSVNRPLQFAPGTEGRYRNCDPLTLGYIMRQLLRSDYWTFPQHELFDKVGIRKQILETDPYGNFLLTGYDYGTARNWARLGLLYLQDGVFDGKRLLPEGFADFVSTPAPGWKQPVYGGQFWLLSTGEGGLPEDAYYMAGAGGQRTIIVPSLDLVIVRMGHFRGGAASEEPLANACTLIVKALSS